MYDLRKVILAFSVFICCACYGFPEYTYVSQAELEKSEVVVFAVNTGGPISCGEYGLLVSGLKIDEKLSCLNSKVEANISKFNSKNPEEKFIVIYSLKGDIEHGTEISINNKSTKAFSLGDSYMLFTDLVNGEYVAYECSSFEGELFYDLLSSGIEALTVSDAVSIALEKDALCTVKD